MRRTLQITGTGSLIKRLRKNQSLDDVRKTVRKHTAELTEDMQREASFSGIYTTGATKRSISMEMRDNGMTGAVQPFTFYSPYVEYGTRFMDAQPFVRPAFEKRSPLFISDMQKLLK